MSVLDPTSLFVVGGLVLTLAGTAFLLETMLRLNDAVGRLWSVFYLCGMFAIFAYIVTSFAPDTWWAIGAGHGAFVSAVGFLWAGARRANDRRPLVALAVVPGAIVAGATLIRGADAGPWAGAVEMFLGVALVGSLAASEFMRGALARLLAGRVLAAVTAGLAAYYLARAVVFAAYGPSDPVFAIAFGTVASSMILIAFTVIGTIMLSSVQRDRFTQQSEGNADAGARVHIDGMLSARQFRSLAETWLLRGLRERVGLVMLLIEVADLAAINTAFGRVAGDAAIRATGRITLTQAPTAAVVGHLSARRFAILMEAPSSVSVEAIADRIQEGVLGAVIDDHDRFRASTFRGVSTTRSSGASYAALLAAAERAVAEDAALAAERELELVAPES